VNLSFLSYPGGVVGNHVGENHINENHEEEGQAELEEGELQPRYARLIIQMYMIRSPV
jgi:hypothetical protein